MEALVIIFVFAVAVIIFVTTWIGTVYGTKNAASELDQLQAYHEVLQRKALRAQLERWDDGMMNQIAEQLDEVEQRIARLANPT